MIFPSVLMAALLLATDVNAVFAKAMTHLPYGGLRRRDVEFGGDLAFPAYGEWNKRLYARATTSSSLSTATSSASSAVPDSSAIAAACLAALATEGDIATAAGIAGCYNILSLDMSTGIFEADLRLYQLADPSGLFAGVTSGTINVSPSFPFAQEQVSSTTKRVRSVDSAKRAAASSLSELRQFSLVGKIDDSLTLSKLNSTDLMALVIPRVLLEAVSPSTNSPVTAELTSASTIYFVTGVFGGQSTAGTAASSQAAAVAAETKAAPFVLPGTKLGIFPIGLIVTGSWAVLFISTVAVGAIGKWRHRAGYRSRLLRRTWRP